MSVSKPKGAKIKAATPRISDAQAEQSSRKRRDDLQSRRGVLANILTDRSVLKSLLG